MSTLVERLRELSAKWRRAAVDWRNCGCEARACANEQHADELDAILAEPVGEAEIAADLAARQQAPDPEFDGLMARNLPDFLDGTPPAPSADKAGVDDAVERVAKAIADVIGHGMAEKCEPHARAALAAAAPQAPADPMIELHRNTQETLNRALKNKPNDAQTHLVLRTRLNAIQDCINVALKQTSSQAPVVTRELVITFKEAAKKADADPDETLTPEWCGLEAVFAALQQPARESDKSDGGEK